MIFGVPTVASADGDVPIPAPSSSEPTDPSTNTPTPEPTETPTPVPTDTPTDIPTDQPTDSPTDTPTDQPVGPAPTTEPIAVVDPILLEVGTMTTPNATEVALISGGYGGGSLLASVYSAAQFRYNAAIEKSDAANFTYTSTAAKYEAALDRADLVHRLATKAERAADSSKRALATLVRELLQQGSGTASINAFIDGGSSANMLDQLSAIDKLSDLTGNMQAIAAGVETDDRRAKASVETDKAAQEALLGIPVVQTQTAMDAAKTVLTTATVQLAALSSSSQAGASQMTALATLLATFDTGQLSDQGWAIPAIGHINDPFGPRPIRPVAEVGDFHYGTDIGASCGAPIYAATSGIVEAADSEGTYGKGPPII